jgi:hypothetical protein
VRVAGQINFGARYGERNGVIIALCDKKRLGIVDGMVVIQLKHGIS